MAKLSRKKVQAALETIQEVLAYRARADCGASVEVREQGVDVVLDDGSFLAADATPEFAAGELVRS